MVPPIIYLARGSLTQRALGLDNILHPILSMNECLVHYSGGFDAQTALLFGLANIRPFNITQLSIAAILPPQKPRIVLSISSQSATSNTEVCIAYKGIEDRTECISVIRPTKLKVFPAQPDKRCWILLRMKP